MIITNKNISFKKYLLRCLIIILFLPLIFIAACSEDPVTTYNQEYIFDSARYNWKIDTLPRDFFDIIWGIDTSSIYILGSNIMLKYDGQTYSTIFFPDDFAPFCMGGIDNQTIYIGGAGHDGARLFSFNGISFNEIIIQDSLGYRLFHIYIYNSNEVWFGSTKGRLIKLYENNIVNYSYDTNYSIRPLLKKSENEFYIYGSNYSENRKIFKIFNFNNNIWNEVFIQIINNGDTTSSIRPLTLNDEILGLTRYELLKFQPNSFYKIMSLPFHADQNPGAVGDNEESFIVLGFINNAFARWIYHWNGKKWSKEIIFPSGPTVFSKKIQEKYVIVESDSYNQRCLITYGTRK